VWHSDSPEPGPSPILSPLQKPNQRRAKPDCSSKKVEWAEGHVVVLAVMKLVQWLACVSVHLTQVRAFARASSSCKRVITHTAAQGVWVIFPMLLLSSSQCCVSHIFGVSQRETNDRNTKTIAPRSEKWFVYGRQAIWGVPKTQVTKENSPVMRHYAKIGSARCVADCPVLILDIRGTGASNLMWSLSDCLYTNRSQLPAKNGTNLSGIIVQQTMITFLFWFVNVSS